MTRPKHTRQRIIAGVLIALLLGAAGYAHWRSLIEKGAEPADIQAPMSESEAVRLAVHALRNAGIDTDQYIITEARCDVVPNAWVLYLQNKEDPEWDDTWSVTVDWYTKKVVAWSHHGLDTVLDDGVAK